MTTELSLLTVSLLIVFLYQLYRIGSRDSTLPPGPPTVPLLGYKAKFSSDCFRSIHLKLSEWARKYGDFYSLKMGPETFIILTSAKAVKEFLDMRGPSTADRPAAHIPEQVHEGYSLAFGRYSTALGSRWKLMRKTVHAILTPASVEETYPIQFAESVQLLYDLLHDPKSHFQHVRRLLVSIIFSVLYGKRVPRYESYEATSMFDLLHLEEQLFLPGAQLPVDTFPFLKYLPEGPLAPWKKKCRDLKGLHQRVYFGSLEQCKDRIDRGESVGCLMEQIFERYQKEFGLTWQEVSYIGGTLLPGGIDTSTSLLQGFILSPLPFECSIQPRNQKIADLIHKHFVDAIDVFTQYEGALQQEDKEYVARIRSSLV
ncbi:cytochrome P450 [Dendrothele bispora CBS 962.96]|uniref:Cytochrome P450 n=1 Tax=Dendrothele bispora (strain CBS 962.96) TaxID=1314807 RepID=A0A4V4HIK2_DENBC|nr:cytochrome P450 [Dendrothele bispora CBS 962.96]